MNSLEETTKYIYNKTRNTKLSRFSDKEIQLVLFLVNAYIEDYNSSTNIFGMCLKEKEIDKSLNEYVIEECHYEGLEINEDELDEIMRIRKEVESEGMDSEDDDIDYSKYRFINEEDMWKEYKIKKWSKWSDIVGDAIEDFCDEFGEYPNYLLANEHIFSQIDFMVNIIPGAKQNVFDYNKKTGEDLPIKEDEDISIGSYGSTFYNVEFEIDNDVKDKSFVLLYESDNDDEGDDDNNDDVIKPTPVDKLSVVF